MLLLAGTYIKDANNKRIIDGCNSRQKLLRLCSTMKNIKRKHFIQQIHVLAEEFQQVHRRDPKQALALCADIEELSITHDYKRGIALADLCRASAYFIQ